MQPKGPRRGAQSLEMPHPCESHSPLTQCQSLHVDQATPNHSQIIRIHNIEQLACCNRWNFTPSPGWTKEEAAILKLCLMKYGVGKWVQILETGLLPGKLIQQLNGQAQRLLGQQSLAGVMPPIAVYSQQHV